MSKIFKINSSEVCDKISHIRNLFIIDVRSHKEIMDEGIPDFGENVGHYINLPWSMEVDGNIMWLDSALKVLMGYPNVLVICAYGIRSSYACDLLSTVKNLNIIHVLDGTDGCKVNGITFKSFEEEVFE